VRKFLPPLSAIFRLGEARSNEIRSQPTCWQAPWRGALPRPSGPSEGIRAAAILRSERIERSAATSLLTAPARDEKRD